MTRKSGRTPDERARSSRELREKAGLLIRKLGAGLFEREEAVRLCFLSAMAGESVFLLGPPGVAKSLIARRLKEIFAKEAKSFTYLMNRFSTPDEIFGPVSIKALREDDQLVRITGAYLPGATVVFLDEIWKAGPSIQNTLLTVLNERIFRNGAQEEQVKLRALISASNELPAEGEGLEALWDRFLVRLEVQNIESRENRRAFLRGGALATSLDEIGEQERLSAEECDRISRAIDDIELPEAVLDVIEELVERIRLRNQEAGDAVQETAERSKPKAIYVSDRRWKKICRLLRASALLNGRSAVDMADCLLIRHCIWDEPGQIPDVDDMVLKAVLGNLGGRQVAERKKAWETLRERSGKLPRPETFRGEIHKLDLSQHGSRLTLSKGRIFGSVRREEFLALKKRFGTIHLLENGRPLDKAAQVTVLGRQGSSGSTIVIKSETANELPPFPPTEFPLLPARPASPADAGDPVTREAIVAELDRFAQGLQEGAAALRNQGTAIAAYAEREHLFVSLPRELRADLGTAIDLAVESLKGLAGEVRKLRQESGLA